MPEENETQTLGASDSVEQTAIVYGASDDLVEVDGAFSEEWGCWDAQESTVIFGDGTELGIAYGPTEPTWTIRLKKAGTATVLIEKATDDVTDYSDRATVTGDLGSVRFRKGPKCK